VISQVFGELVPSVPTAGQTTVLEALEAGIASQIAVLEDPGLTGAGQSSADLLGVSAGTLAPERAAGLIGEATQLARQRDHTSDEQFWIGRGLAGVASAVAAFDLGLAAALAEQAQTAMTGLDYWGSAAALITGAFAAAGRWDQAMRTGGDQLTSDERASVLGAVARALAASGQWDTAERTAGDITVPAHRAIALASVSAQVASSDLHRSVRLANEAEQLASNLTGRFQREDALASVADELLTAPHSSLEAGNHNEFRACLHRILGRVLTSEGWFFALPALGEVSADAIAAVYERIPTGEPVL
jgi:hypothetical protein